jgi:hypothetical protein
LHRPLGRQFRKHPVIDKAIGQRAHFLRFQPVDVVALETRSRKDLGPGGRAPGSRIDVQKLADSVDQQDGGTL